MREQFEEGPHNGNRGQQGSRNLLDEISDTGRD
jgi:hypothetical protein